MMKKILSLLLAGLLVAVGVGQVQAGIDWWELPEEEICRGVELKGNDPFEVDERVEIEIKAFPFEREHYRVDWGDGKVEQVNDARVSHKYDEAGNFTVRVKVKTPKGEWVTSDVCQIKVRVMEEKVAVGGVVPSVFAQEGEEELLCSRINVEGNESQVPADLRIIVHPNEADESLEDDYDYRIDLGDGTGIVEDSDGVIRHTYTRAGVYDLRAWVHTDQGGWSENECMRTLTIKDEGQPLEEGRVLVDDDEQPQKGRVLIDESPEVGMPWIVLAGGGLSIAGGLGLVLRKRK